MRQRLLPLTAGDMQVSPERVLAPQRLLASIGPLLRKGLFVIRLTGWATKAEWLRQGITIVHAEIYPSVRARLSWLKI